MKRARRTSLLPPIAALALGASAFVGFAAPAHAQQAARVTREVRFDQKLDAQIPLDTTFRDETGATVQIGSYFHEKPVVLSLVYFSCPMLCTQVLNGLSASMRRLDSLAPGDDYDIVTISIDPKETPELAASKKQSYVEALGKPHGAQGWHFLTGDKKSIDRIADAVGFRYFFDEGIQQFAHPGGIVVLTPDGRVSRYFFDVVFPERDLRLALVESSVGHIGSLIDRLTLLCYHYDPQTGKYGFAIFTVLRLLGAITVVGVGSFILVMLRRDRRELRAGAHA